MYGITHRSTMAMPWPVAPESGQPPQQSDSAMDTAEHVPHVESSSYEPLDAPLEFDGLDPSQFENDEPMQLDIDTSLFEEMGYALLDDDVEPSRFADIEEMSIDAVCDAYFAPLEFYPSDVDLEADQSPERNKRLLNKVRTSLAAHICEAVNRSRTSTMERRAVIRTHRKMESCGIAITGFGVYDIPMTDIKGNCIHFAFWHGADGDLRLQIVVEEKEFGLRKTSEVYDYPEKSKSAATAGLCLFWAAVVAKKFIMGLDEAARAVRSYETHELRLNIVERMLAADPVRLEKYRGRSLGKRLREFIVIRKIPCMSARSPEPVAGGIQPRIVDRRDPDYASMLLEAWQKACAENLNISLRRRLGKTHATAYEVTTSGLDKDRPIPKDFEANRVHYEFRRNPDDSIVLRVFANRKGLKTEMLGEATSYQLNPHMFMTWATLVAKELLSGKAPPTGEAELVRTQILHSKIRLSTRWQAYRDANLVLAFSDFAPAMEAPAPNYLIRPTIVPASLEAIDALCRSKPSDIPAALGAAKDS